MFLLLFTISSFYIKVILIEKQNVDGVVKIFTIILTHSGSSK